MSALRITAHFVGVLVQGEADTLHSSRLVALTLSFEVLGVNGAEASAPAPASSGFGDFGTSAGRLGQVGWGGVFEARHCATALRAKRSIFFPSSPRNSG